MFCNLRTLVKNAHNLVFNIDNEEMENDKIYKGVAYIFKTMVTFN